MVVADLSRCLIALQNSAVDSGSYTETVDEIVQEL